MFSIAACQQRRSSPFLFSVSTILLSFLLPLPCLPALLAQEQDEPPSPPFMQAPFAQPQDRITSFIDEDHRFTLRGNTHPMAVAQNDSGPVATDFPMEHMLLTLLPDSEQMAALDRLLEEQQNPESPYYHQWVSPEQFGERFGVSDSDIAQVVGWLAGHGMQIEAITAGRRSIIFSGTAAQVEAAFHTAIHLYRIGEHGEVHSANAQDPSIPAALAQVVGGVVSLHNFVSQPLHGPVQNGPVQKPSPEFTSGGAHYLAPEDFATIYDVNPLYQQSINGGGQSIAIVGRSNLKLADIAQFRTFFGLPANNPQIIVNGTDPGIVSANEETEADLDVEWSGAVGRNATIKFVVSKSTNSSDGVDLSAQYIVNNNLAPIMSTSFGLCEASLGSSGNSFLNALWKQAAAQGITVLVSAGDNGAAGCDSASAATATHGRAVNGLCSTAYDICVGGTEFNDGANPSLYWAGSNASGTQSSALSYIPEVVWNESAPGEGLWATGGGASMLYAKPSWQAGAGVPADGKRDVPDVALTAAGHDGYLMFQEGSLYVVGGTSASSPSFAGVMALAVQHAAGRQGNANTVFYSLAAKQHAGGASVFHDIVSGNNSVPGVSGFTAAAGYDQTTGLGSIDASVLVNHWGDATPPLSPAFQAALSANTLAVTTGSYKSITLTVSVSGGFDAAVGFSITGLPSGVSATFTPATLAAPGSGESTIKIAAGNSAKAGTYSITVSAAGGSYATQKMPLSITIAR